MPTVDQPFIFNRAAKVLGPDGKPWQEAEGVEPGFDLPHVWTFSSIIGAAWRSYWQGQQDDALANDPEYAIAMERDPLVMSIVQERCKATVNREWDIKVDNDRDPAQKALATGLKKVVNKIPHKRQLFSYMLEGAVWAGRVASELKYVPREISLPHWQNPDQMIRVKVPMPVGHQPIDGDKLNWTYDGIPTIQIYNPKSSSIPNSAVIAGTASRSIALLGSWRNKFIIHSHEVRDAPYWMARRASSIYGLGVRHFIYWLSWLKRELLANILTYAERTGMGLRIWKYQAGNDASKRAVQEAAENQSDRTNLLLPVTMTPGGRPVEGVEFVESGSTIATLLMDILRKFDDDIERFIIGQSMSSGVEATGLGSEGIAGFQEATKANLCEYDADNFGETMTSDLVRKMGLWVYPKELVEDADPKFAFQVAPPSAEKVMAVNRSYFDMGGEISSEKLREVTTIPAPKPGDKVLSFMALQQAQTELQTEAAQQQAAMGVQTGGSGGTGAETDETGVDQEPSDDDYDSVMKQLTGEPSKNARDGEPVKYSRPLGPDEHSHLARHHAAMLHHHLGESAPLALHHLRQRLKADPASARLHAAATRISDALEPDESDHEEVRQRIMGSSSHNGHPARFAMPGIVRDLDAAEKARNPAGPMKLPHEDIASEAERRLGSDAPAKAQEVERDLTREAADDPKRHHPKIVAKRVNKHLQDKSQSLLSTVPIVTGEEEADLAKVGRGGGSKAIDIARYLTDRSISKAGRKLNTESNEDLERLSGAMAHEAKHALSQDDSAVGWYDATLKEAMSHIHDFHPELKKKPEHDSLYKILTAITSNGQNVEVNLPRADELYDGWKSTGRIETNGIYGGPSQKIINQSLTMLQDMIDRIGLKNTKKFLDKDFTTKQLAQKGYKVNGELVDTNLKGANIFGPKIGSFYGNLNGDFSSVTMDRWFMRTFGRLAGTLTEQSPEAIKKAAARVMGAVQQINPRDEQALYGLPKGQLLGQLKATIASGDATQAPDAMKWAIAQYRQYANGGFKEKTPANQAAKTLVDNIQGMNEAPKNGKQRQWIRKVMAETQKKLKKEGVHLENADLQAVLWYYEKRLWSKLGYNVKKANPSNYATVAKSMKEKKRAAAKQPATR